MPKSEFKAQDFSPSEDAEQMALMEWAAWSPYRKELKWLHHTPNELRIPTHAKVSPERLRYVVGANLKRLGLKAGVADLFLPVAKGKYHGLWIEMKRVHGGTLTDRQADFLRDMINEGYAARVAHGAEEAESIIKAYLEGRLEEQS